MTDNDRTKPGVPAGCAEPDICPEWCLAQEVSADA